MGCISRLKRPIMNTTKSLAHGLKIGGAMGSHHRGYNSNIVTYWETDDATGYERYLSYRDNGDGVQCSLKTEATGEITERV